MKTLESLNFTPHIAFKSYHQALLLCKQVERQGDVSVQPADGAVTHVMVLHYDEFMHFVPLGRFFSR